MLLQTLSTAAGIFSIWLVPPPGVLVTSKLVDIVSELATEFAPAGASNFTPHVTIVPDIHVDPVEAQAPLLAKLRAVAGTIEPFNLTFAANPIHTTAEWSQSMVAYVDVSAKLADAHRKLTAEFNGHKASTTWKEPSEHPHVSLIYATLGPAQKEAAKTRVLQDAPWLLQRLSFPVEELQLWLTGSKVSDVTTWTPVGVFPLKGVASKRVAGEVAKAA